MEVLAATSSVLAVVSLALQLATTVQHLVDFWETVKDAPAEVEEIRSQLRVLSALLRSIEVDTKHSSDDDGSSLAHDCLLICQRSIFKLEKLSKKWNDELSRGGMRQKWSCVRKAMKEKELASYWDELERTKSTLLLYQSSRNG